jgi:hypothetical protein
MARLEYAAGDQRVASRSETYPLHWGRPPADLSERSGWVSGHLSADLIRAGRPSNVRALAPGVEAREHTRPTGGTSPRHALLHLLERAHAPWERGA